MNFEKRYGLVDNEDVCFFQTDDYKEAETLADVSNQDEDDILVRILVRLNNNDNTIRYEEI